MSIGETSPSGLRVFHGLENISGIPALLAREERRQGLASDSVCYPGAFDYPVHRVVNRAEPEKNFRDALERYDVFNFHFGYGFYGQSHADLQALVAMGKRVNMFFHGCDVRDSKVVIEKYDISACQVCWPMACNANRKEMRAWACDHADHMFVSTPDLLEFLPGAIWLPQPVSLGELEASAGPEPARTEGRAVRVAHVPSAPLLKGTAYLREAVNQLREEGLPIELVSVSGMPHSDALRAIRAADVVVDQLLSGAYGVAAIEAMALGKPTIGYIREDLRAHYPVDLPMLSASIHTIADVLRALVQAPESWAEIGRRSQDYVARTHDAGQVVARLLGAYGAGRRRTL